jgi:SAM-dependent methyltransferase
MSSAVERIMPGFKNFLGNEHLDGKTIIDIGCGFGTWGHAIRSFVFRGGDKAYLVGCDIFRPFILKNKKYNPYDDLVLCDARHLPFQRKCADIVLSLEMIEHLDKELGFKFLENLDVLSKDRILVSTPYGYLEQHDTDETQFEEHKSVWYAKDFKKKGYIVRKYGIAWNLEALFYKLNLFSILNRIALLESKGNWTGVVLLAEKHPRKTRGVLMECVS